MCTTPQAVRQQALGLPEVQEGTHFKLPAFRVQDKVFLVLQSDEHAVLHVDADTAAATSRASSAVEQTYRGSTLIGVRVHLPELTAEQMWPIIVAAGRHRAPMAPAVPRVRDRWERPG